jgi:hypothetical protein
MRRSEMRCLWPVVVAALLLLAVQPALAAIVLCSPASTVDSNVISNSGVYQYQFTVTNTSQCTGQGSPVMVDFELPLQSPESVSSIVSPGYWSYEILTSAEFFSDFGITNPFASDYVLHWYDTLAHPSENGLTPANLSESIVPIGFEVAYQRTDVYENSASGFGFSSLMGPIAGPYESSWLTTNRLPGDPPLPGNPTIGGVGAPGLPPFSPSGVPEPVSLVLAALGLGLFGGLRAVRARRVAPGAPTGR